MGGGSASSLVDADADVVRVKGHLAAFTCTWFVVISVNKYRNDYKLMLLSRYFHKKTRNKDYILVS